MYCEKCGTRNDFDAIFCKKCGYNFNKNRSKKNIIIRKIISFLIKNKEIIIKSLLGILLVIIILVLAYNNSYDVKLKKYLKKDNYICKSLKCTKNKDNYNYEIKVNDNKIIYTVSKVNEKIILTYVGDGLGTFEVTDSLSTFTCFLKDSNINTESCDDELNKAGHDYYYNKMEEMYKYISKIPMR